MNIVTIRGKIPSLNVMYFRRKGGGVYLNPEVYDLKSKVDEDLTRSTFKSTVMKAISEVEDPVAELRLDYVLTDDQYFWSRDSSNLIKSVEDAIQDVIGLNDNRNMRVTSNKILNDLPNPLEMEYIIVTVTIHEKDKYTYKLSDWLNEDNFPFEYNKTLKRRE